MIKDFTYLSELLEDVDFRTEYARMQDIYVFKEEHKVPLEQAFYVIEAILSIQE